MIGKWFLSVGILLATTTTVAAQERMFEGVVTSGSITLMPGGLGPHADYDLSGDGFRVVAIETDPGFSYVFLRCIAAPPGCRPGDTLPLTAVVGNTDMGEGSAMVNGEVLSPAYMTAYFEFLGGSVTLPRGNRKRVILSAPFTFSHPDGTPLPIWIYPDPVSRSSGPGAWAQGQLTGTGTATLLLERERTPIGTFYIARRLIYNFNVP